MHARRLASFAFSLAVLGLAALTVAGAERIPPPRVESVNTIVGDAGFEAVVGRSPKTTDSEALRIRTHLAYVEGVLRSRDLSGLAPDAHAARLRLLDTLAVYRRAGVFPQNTLSPHRKPVFIDGDGRICAVGRLVEASVGRAASEAIAATHRLDRIAEMPASVVVPWAAAHGFSLTELAMIQPTYCGDDCPTIEPIDEPLSNGVEIAALAAGGLAAGLNLGLLARGERSRVAGGASAALGGGLLYLGLSGRGSWDGVDAAVGGAALAAGLLQALRPAPQHRASRLSVLVLPSRNGAVRLSARLGL